MKPKTTLAKKDLIVVLACIVFLLANIAAIGPRGRRHAKQMLCLSNLRKLGGCFQAFAADNNGYFHEGWGGLPDCMYDNQGSHWWFHALKPYYENQNLCLCPEAAILGNDVGYGEIGATFFAWFAQGWLGPPRSVYGSYGINGWVENNRCEIDVYPHLRWRTPNVAGGANIPLLLDSQWIDAWPDHTDDPPEYDDQDWRLGSQMGRFCINRHSGFVNSAFLDFSARKVGLKQLWTLKWHRQYNTCGPWTTCGGVTRDDWAHYGTGWMKDLKDY